MNAYSKDLGPKALEAVDRGIPRKGVVRIFALSLATLERAALGKEENPGISPQSPTGENAYHRGHRRAEEGSSVGTQLEAHDDDATLERHCELWEEEQGAKVSIATMSRAIRRLLGWTLKKRVWVPPSETKKREVLGISG